MQIVRCSALLGVCVFLSLGCGDKSPKVSAGDTVPVVGQVLPTRGPTEGGTVAVVKGLNFRPGTTVAFGPSPASFVKVVDATTLTVVTPPGDSGPVKVVVTGPEGQSTTFADGFTYYVKDTNTAPPPVVSSIQPNTGPASGGTVALVTGGELQDGALLFVGRSPASDVVVADAQHLSGTLPPNDVGAADVEVTNPDGQTVKLAEAFAYYDGEGVGPVIAGVSPLAGTTSGGTTVSIAGANFKAGALVFFGGKTGGNVTVGSVAVTASTPPSGPGVVDVAVTNPDGRSAVARRAYNYYLGGPVIARITPNFGPPDGGTDVVIEGRHFDDRIIASIGGRAIAGLRRIDDRTLSGTTPGGPAGTVDVRVENFDGQQDTLVNGFAYGNAPPPTFSVARVTPEVGPIAGGTRVTVIGAGFASGATVTFGGQPATGVQVVGGATISAVTPAGAVGPVDVEVTQAGRAAKLSLGYWYFDPSKGGPTPSIANITPALGPQTGGTTVLVTGGGFAPGARVFFGTKEATAVTVVNGSTLSATTAAADSPGPVDVRLQNPDGQVVTQQQGFVFVDPSSLGPAPVLTSVTPNQGGSADTTPVAVAAQNVNQGALVFAGGVPATAVTVGTGTVDASFGPHEPGVVDVVITNPDGQSGRLTSGFTYQRSPPTLSGVTPNTVPLAGGLKVLLSGKGFVPGATVSIGGTQVPPTFVDSTLLFVTAPAHAVGQVDVVVTNPDSQLSTLANGLTYADIQLGNAPTVTSVAPLRGPTTGGTVALVVGTNFAAGARVLFGAVPATRVTVMSPTRLSAVAPANPLGIVDLTVVNADGQSAQLLQAFTYVDRGSLGPGPQLASVTPSSGVATGGTQTVLTGSGFQQGLLVFFGGFSAAAAAVQNGGISTATTPAGPSGQVDVSVTNPDGQSSTLANGYSYTPRPEPQTIFPAEGPTAGGVAFTIAGRNFGAGARTYFGTVEATAAQVQSSTVITGSTPPQVAGTYDVRIVNPDGQAGALTQGFTYNAAPTAVLARPGAGPVTGGTTILVTGTGFRPSATVTVGGQAATQVRIVSATELYAVTPAGAAGAADVVVTNPDQQNSRITGGFRYELIDAVAQRATTFPTVFVPMARDDAQYRTNLGVVNLSAAPVTVTVSSFDGAGVQVGSRALAAPIPAYGRAQVADVLRFIEAVTASTGRTASLAVTADGPVSAYTALTDVTTSDASFVLGETAARAAARVLVPYASSVGAFRTWLAVRNAGSGPATVTITARDATGAQVGQLTAITVAGGGQYSTDDVLGAMSLAGQTATLEVAGTGAQLLVAARTYSNARLGGLVWGRPAADAARTQTLAYVPDTSTETSSIYLFNTDSTGSAAVTVDLRTAVGQSLGSRQYTVPASGFVQVPDLARTLLGRTNPTQTISSAQVTADKPVLATAFVLTTSSSDIRLYNARPGGGVRLLLPAADARTSLTVVNVGVAAANLEATLTVDSGAPRGLPVRVTVPPRGSFSAPLLLTSLGAGTSNGVVEVRSLNGMPLVAVAKVTNDPAGLHGDTMDLGNVLTLPSVDGIRPNQGPAAGGTMSTVQGGYLLPGITFLYGSRPSPRAATYTDGVAVVVSPAGTGGDVVDLTAINYDGSAVTRTQAFSYILPSLLGPAPAVSSVQPTQLSTLGGTAMQINGSDFVSNAQAFVGLRPVAGAVQVNPTRVDGAAPSGPIGPADVTVTNPDGQSSTLTGAVVYVVPPPGVASVTPNSGPGGGGTTVRLNGTGFQVGATVGFGPTSSPLVTVLSSTDIDAVTPSGADGPVAVNVVNPDGQSTTVNNGFTYVAPPTVAQVSPTSGPTTGGTNITITGTFLRQGATVLVGSTACTNVNVAVGGTTITCTTPAGTAGPVAVRVTNSDGQYGVLNNAFTYLAPVPPPTVTAVSPAFGPITGNTQVTVQGTGFQAGATVLFGTLSSTAVTVISPTALLATTPGAAAVGAVAVRVTNPDSQFGQLPNAFTYYQPADLPGIGVVSLTPNEGPPTGGTQVFISGQGFKAGVTVRFRTTLATNVVYLGPSALLATAPAGALGMASVTATNPDSSSSTLANGFNYTAGVAFRPPPMRLPMTQERGYTLVKMLDYDGDGDMDAFLGRRAVSCDSDGNDELWTNDGTGTFVKLATFPGDAARVTSAALAADFDGNGTTDLFVLSDSNYTSGAASFYKNFPLGTFVRTDVSYSNPCCSSQPIRDAAAGDLDGDGYLDVYVAAGGGVNFWFRNNRNGTFTASRNGFPSITTDSRGVCIADYDRDGDQDVFVVNASNQQANLYLQGPAATFTNAGTTNLPVVGGAGVACAAGEFRPGSGITDVVVVKDGQIYQYLKNDGQARFADEGLSLGIYRLPNSPPTLNVGFNGAVGMVRGIQPVDIDSDGDLDLMMNHPNAGPRIQAYINDGAGFFTLGTASRVPRYMDSQEWFEFVDVNSDGRPDTIIPGEGTQPRLLLGGPGGVLSYATMRTLPEDSTNVSDALAMDIDGDGDKDLVLATAWKYDMWYTWNGWSEPASYRNRSVRIWLNDGAGGFTDDTTNRINFLWAATALTSGDVDNDGDQDLVIGTSGMNPAAPGTRDQYGIRVYLNNGLGIFTDVSYPRIPRWQQGFSVVKLIDINKDGALDVYGGYSVYSCSGGHVLGLNTGNGFFFDVTGQLPYASWGCTGFFPYEAAVADYNGDTYPDFYLVGNGQNKLFLNRGVVAPGYYLDVTASNVPNVSDNSYSVRTGDLNGDTFPDIFTCNAGSGAAAVDRINLGSPTGVLSDITATNWPTESQPYPYQSQCGGSVSPLSSLSCDLGDVDGDGDLDVVAGGWNVSNINMRARLFINAGNALFSDRTTASLPYDTNQTAKVVLFDANGDGKLDLFVGNNGQSVVYLQ